MNGPAGDQPIEIFPAITFFADVMTALPKELVRHFTLLREVDAKLCAPEDQLFRLVSQAISSPYPDIRPNNGSGSIAAPSSAPMSAQNSSSGIVPNGSALPPPSTAESANTVSGVFDPSNIPRRQLFRQTAIKIQEMIVSLEEKNHVIGTANEALQKQLARIEDVWPYLETEFSDEAKWGSNTHWAYPENRTGKSHPERTRREGAAFISAAAEALAAEAAARTDARKQAMQAKKNQRNQNHESDFDDHDNRNHKNEGGKKTGQSKVRKTAEANNVGLGITSSGNTNGNPPSKKRKVENSTNGATAADRAVAAAVSGIANKSKPGVAAGDASVPENPPKKRKALPSSSTQAKKKNGIAQSPSVASSPVIQQLPEPKGAPKASPTLNNVPRPTTSRARQNSLQSGHDNGKARPPSSAANKSNGIQPVAQESAPVTAVPRASSDSRSVKESSVSNKIEPPEKPENGRGSTPAPAKKEVKPEEHERRKSESIPPTVQTIVTVTTKSGRASKPSTPALAAFQDTPRPRLPRNSDSAGNKKSQKKSAPTPQTLVPPSGEDDLTSGEGDIDADEPTYCYCNSVSYGEMVACDADGCAREWFHLACVGLKVAPAEKSKWYCEDCKDRLKIGNKKSNGR